MPSAASASATTETMLAESVMSRRIGAHTPPNARISFASSSSRSVRRPVIATFAPAFANTIAKRRPRPEVVPVTSATCPVRSMLKFGVGKSVMFSVP